MIWQDKSSLIAVFYTVVWLNTITETIIYTLNISILVSEFFIIWHTHISKENMSSERNNFVFGRLTSKAASYIDRNWKLKYRIKDDLPTSCKVIKYSRRVAWRGGEPGTLRKQKSWKKSTSSVAINHEGKKLKG